MGARASNGPPPRCAMAAPYYGYTYYGYTYYGYTCYGCTSYGYTYYGFTYLAIRLWLHLLGLYLLQVRDGFHSYASRCERSGCNSLSRYTDPNSQAGCAPRRSGAAQPAAAAAGANAAVPLLVLLLLVALVAAGGVLARRALAARGLVPVPCRVGRSATTTRAWQPPHRRAAIAAQLPTNAAAAPPAWARSARSQLPRMTAMCDS